MTSARETWHVEHAIETTATPEAVWAVLRDVPGWTKWNAGIERIHLEGPFAEGTWFTMQPPGEEAFRSRLALVRENECFVDETQVGDLVVVVVHRIERVAGGNTRVTYALDATGPGASEVGPAVSADFPAVLAALVTRVAEVRA